ncbi:MAG TPA: DNA primase [Syntrophaceae bacterium]|nr:DNA primase [Syntrophaceae bacterium]
MVVSDPVFQKKIDEIRNLADIVQVISEHLNLKKVGRNYIGLCPFHSESKPSFIVSAEKQIYHCFGCGAGGNVFNFLMAYHNLSFFEALKELARKYGVILSHGRRSSYERQQDEIRSKLLDINRLAAAYYHENLLKDPEGKKALSYLSHRGITHDVILQHKLGYAKQSWNDLRNFLERKNTPLDLAEKAGLLVVKKGGDYYDRFRDRIIFPIMEVRHEVVGFGGRVLDESLPKYINSPETPVYHKSRCLYGLNVAKDFIRKEGYLLIVEGYLDLLALHTHGIKNVVSTLGTALTKDHIRRLKGYGDQAVVIFDSDQAGLNAATRSLSLFLEEGLMAKILMLPQGFDPDSYIFQFGKEAFEKALKNVSSLFEFFVDRVLKDFGTSTEGKIRALKELVPVLASVKNSMDQSVYIKKVAEALKVDEGVIYKAVKESQRGRVPELKMERTGISSPDQKIIQFLINHPRYFPVFLEAGVIDDVDDKNPLLICTLMKELFHKFGHVDVGLLVQKLEDSSLRSMVTEWALKSAEDDEEDLDQVVKDMVSSIKNRRIRKEAKNILSQIKENEDNTHLLSELLAKKRELTTIKR